MDTRIPQTIIPFKTEIEALARIEILIEHHSDGVAYFDGNSTVFVNLNLPTEAVEEKIFHELTHVYFKHSGYPKTSVINRLTPEEKKRIERILNFPEEIIVDKYLSIRHFPFDDSFYNTVLPKVLASTDRINTSSDLIALSHHLRYIKLLIDENHMGENIIRLKEKYIRVNGRTNWEFVSSVADGLKEILSLGIENKEKLYRMYLVMLEEFDVANKVLINFSR